MKEKARSIASYSSFSFLTLEIPTLEPKFTVFIISGILNKFKESQAVQDVFYGLRPASTGLIITAGIGVARIALLTIYLRL